MDFFCRLYNRIVLSSMREGQCSSPYDTLLARIEVIEKQLVGRDSVVHSRFNQECKNTREIERMTNHKKVLDANIIGLSLHDATVKLSPLVIRELTADHDGKIWFTADYCTERVNVIAKDDQIASFEGIF